MLGKLLKYDLKKNFKFLSVFYLLALFFALLTRLFSSIGDSLMLSVLSSVCSGAAISMMFSILINCFMRSWVLFRASLYGDESYLTHTLPIKRETHYASKAVMTFISLFASLLVILLVLAVAYLSEETAQLIKALFEPITTYFDITISAALIWLFAILFLEFAVAVQWGFTGIILGHRFHRGKIGFSVLIGFGAYIASQMLLLLVILGAALLDSSFMDIFVSNDIFAMETGAAKMIILITTLVYAVLLVVGHALNTHFLKKGVNVD